MKRQFLRGLGVLSEEQIDSIMEENGKDIEAAKGELTAVTAERDQLKAQVSERDQQIEGLKKTAGDNEALTQQIEQLQAENKAARVNAAVDMALTLAKARNVKAVRALLEGLDKADLSEDGKVKGLEEQIRKLQTGDDTKFLFEDPKPAAPKGTTPADGGDDKPAGTTKADFLKMSSKEQMAYIKEHPNWQNELA